MWQTIHDRGRWLAVASVAALAACSGSVAVEAGGPVPAAAYRGYEGVPNCTGPGYGRRYWW